ncbi:nascent polypeptide-associated complex subunit alpha, muscle-specific form isoform X2 [Ischnura elegans]|uniref:nascent polypeptide-associated complex subunit alpha, muscle-specific form isoform X2 n=1 Tax=Ischnura elegans TaxID=197161 RepID=UPI001ED8B518|nr:nascent polypeptide-associated complex subunit alpha, muscle-specific form isoform X2 [Ischnura elegans]
MPGRILDTWTGETLQSDSGGEPPDSSFQHQDSEPSLYGRHTTSLGGALQYEPHQYEGSYGYQLQYPVTTGGGLFVDQQGPYSRGATSLDYQHYPPSPQNHLIATQQQSRTYECAPLHHSIEHHAGTDALHQQQNQPVPSSTACLEMNYGGPQQHRGVQPQRPNPRQQQAHGQLQAQSSPSVYPAPTSHYGSPVHAHLGVHSFPGSQQQWSDYSTTQSRMISSPNSPSPAHTPTPPIASSNLPHSSPPPSQPIHSPPLLPPHSRTPTPTSAIPSPTPSMSGQYPAHQHHSMGPGGSSQGHTLPWGHANVASQPQAIGLHQGGRQPSNSISSQPHNFYGPPMSSSPRGSQPLSCVTGSSPPPTVHSPPTTSVRSNPQWGAVAAHGGGSGSSDGSRMAASKVHAGGPGNPLASLQLLVDQDMNRSGGGGSGAGVPSGSPYRGAMPPNAHSASPSSIDLSAAKMVSEMNVSTPPPVHSPRSHLVYADGSSEGVRNGNSHGASSPAPLRPPVVNGEASSGGDSGIGSPSLGGGAPTPTPPPEGGAPPHISVRPGPVREPIVRAKLPPVAPDVEYIHSIPGQGGEVEPLPLVASGRRQACDSGICQEVADLSRSGFASQARNAEGAQLSGEGLANQTSSGNISRAKGIAVKRNKKVDAILENLVESGSKKLATSGNDRSSPVSLVTNQPSVVVSDAPSATSVIAPTVVVSAPPAPPPAPSPTPAAPGEESTAVAALTPEGPSPAISHPPESPPAQSPENSPRKSSQSAPKSPSRGSGSGDLDDEAVSPTFDDSQGDKPRRKRKPDNPLRLKTPDAEGSTATPASGKTSPPNNVSSKESSSSEESDKANTQDSAIVKDPKIEQAKETVDTPSSDTISETPKHEVSEIKAEKVDGGDSGRDASTVCGPIQNPDLLASPKTSDVEPKREKTTPKTKAEQKYVYRQYEVGDSVPPPKKLEFEQGIARIPPSSPSMDVSSDSVKENERLPLKEEPKPGCVTPNSVSSCAPLKLNPSSKPASIKVEDVFGLDGNALESVVKKVDPISNVAKVEGGSKLPPPQMKDTVTPMARPGNMPPRAPAVTSSPVKAEVKNTFSEVEDQLAMMFAGIIEPEDGQPAKTVPIPELADSKASAIPEPNDVKATVKILPPPNATMEVQEALTTPPSAARKPGRGRPKSVTAASAGDTSCGSIEGSPRKRKRKKFADDEEEDDEVSTPRRTKKSKATDRSPATVTPGSEGEGSGVGTSTAEATPNSGVKRKKKKKKLASESKYASDFPREAPKKRVIVAEEKQPRGPYIRVEGPRDGPRRVTVVNVGSRGGGNVGEDEDGGDKGASRARGRRKPGVGGAKVAKDGSRGGAKAAAPSGSDSSQPDRTWVCVFCRRGSHADGLGDLFGPYFIGRDSPEDDDDEKSDRLEGDSAEAAGKTGKGRRSSGVMDASANKGAKKAKRRWSVTTPGPGFSLGSLDGVATPANPNDDSGDGTGNSRLEVWVHEECALWAAGLYQIGSRIVGLNEAVWSSAKMMCGRCGAAGANIGCVRRGCAQHLHYPCARDHGWQLDEEDFLASCPPHMKGIKSSEPVLPT